MLSLEEAQARLLEGVAPLGAEMLPLERCGGRMLAADLVAARRQPPDPVSAMDGYAVCEPKPGQPLRIVGESPAGAPFRGRVEPGTAVRIATGGVVPPGADRVVMQEIVERSGGSISLLEQPGGASFIRAAGSDFEAGETLVRAGERLTPARLALAAAANAAVLSVHRRPRVAILPSGDELREPGAALAAGDVANSAAYAVAELVESWGGVALRRAILPDDPAACRERLGGAELEADIIVPLGGASVGDRDSLRPLFEEQGAGILFHRVAVQPGKPTWHARFPDGRLVVGLPGNPVSAFVCAYLFLEPLLYRLTGCTQPAFTLVPARLEHDLPPGGGRENFLRGRARIDAEGRLTVAAFPHQDSSLQRLLAQADALVRRRADAPAAAAGEMVEILLLDWTRPGERATSAKLRGTDDCHHAR